MYVHNPGSGQVTGNGRLDTFPTAAEFAEQGLERRVIEIGDDQSTPEIDELIDEVAAKTAGCAGHEDEGIVEIGHAGCCCQSGLR